MSIQLPMMQPERWLSRTDIHITARVTPDTKVPTNMQRRLLRIGILQAILELANSAGCSDVVEQILRPQIRTTEEVVHIAAQTARVVAKAIGSRVVFNT